MLNKRIGGAIIVKDGIAVQSIGFDKYLPIGDPAISVEFLNEWGIDEITVLDISATKNSRFFDVDLLKKMAAKSFVPLAVGGGITTMEHIDALIKGGADKVCLNQVLKNDISLLKRGSEKYGDQCMIACVDFILHNEEYFVYNYATKAAENIKVIDWMKILEENHAGEILLQAVERDGKYCGFDIELYKAVAGMVSIPVIAMGGAGKPIHFKTLFDTADVEAAYAGNFFNFSEHSVITLKKELKDAGIQIRLETFANYASIVVDENNRISKKTDEELDRLLFTKIEKEII